MMSTFDHGIEHRDDGMLVVQANLDDMNPEYTPYITDKLFDAGANDVWWIPIIMKRGRPGLMLNVLVAEDRLVPVEDIIFRETTTLGLRYSKVSCHRLGRELVQVTTKWGKVQVKAGYREGQLIHYAPENRDCEQVARQHNIPLKEVYEEVSRLFLERYRDVN